MKKTLLTIGVAVALMMAWSIVRVQGQQDKKVLFASADHANFQESPTKGVSMAAIWGDAGKGAHGTFTKFVPGFDAGKEGALFYEESSGAFDSIPAK